MKKKSESNISLSDISLNSQACLELDHEELKFSYPNLLDELERVSKRDVINPIGKRAAAIYNGSKFDSKNGLFLAIKILEGVTPEREEERLAIGLLALAILTAWHGVDKVPEGGGVIKTVGGYEGKKYKDEDKKNSFFQNLLSVCANVENMFSISKNLSPLYGEKPASVLTKAKGSSTKEDEKDKRR